MNEEPLYASVTDEDLKSAEKENAKLCKSNDTSVSLYDGGTWYEIDFERCDTHRKLVEWVYHLSEKDWVTGKHIRLFLSHVFVRFPGLNPH